MKLFISLAAMAMTSTALKMDKCKQIPKGAKRRYQPPRTIEQGNNNPAAIDFLLSSRSDLMALFAQGERITLSDEVSEGMPVLGKFAAVTQDQYLGQIFMAANEQFKKMTLDGQEIAKQKFPEIASLYRDNTQRVVKVIRDVVYEPTMVRKLMLDEDITEDIYAAANRFPDEETKVYLHFLDTHLESFYPMIQFARDDFAKAHGQIKSAVSEILESEKQKQAYRQLTNELPLVYQFFNDNIDFIEMQNVDKDLGEAIAGDILYTLAQESGDKQIASMINRNMKFVKTLMTARALEQQKQKVVKKVMGKNKELKAALANEEEFNRLVKEAEAEGQEISKEMEKQIWEQAKQNVKQMQEEQLGNQVDEKHEAKVGKTRYEHIAAIMGLMPDELAQSISAMVQESCPELDLIQIETESMKAIVEEQDPKFLDQLIRELHDVCDMFGLIDSSKMVTKNINGVEVQIYDADWEKGQKVEW
jgi:ribosomal protein L31E